MSTQPVIETVRQQFAETVTKLQDLVRIPSCSFPGFDPKHLDESAAFVKEWIESLGFPECRLIEGHGPFPHVLAKDHRAGPDAPTILLYAHHDVQPPLRDDIWETPAYDPVIRDGRMYGRGSADDKAGVAAIMAACRAWYAQGALPVNVTVLIEGEEELGSPHLDGLVADHLEDLKADALVIADLVNVQTGLPSLTISLRGMVAMDVQVDALSKPLHSGMWGGRVPDPILALNKILASLTDDNGNLTIDGISVPEPDPQALADLARVPFDGEMFRQQAGMFPEAADLVADGATVYRDTWYKPHLSINGIRGGGAKGEAGNVIMDTAWARLSIRITPGMDPEEVAAKTEAALKNRAPAGVRVTVEHEACAPAWGTSTEHPYFAAAQQAFADGYGVEPVTIGCGASIPFVEGLSTSLGGIPAILVPVEDPDTNAHAENESVHLGDLENTAASLAAFLGILSSTKQ